MPGLLPKVHERIGGDQWTPPWVYNQHRARYRWACEFTDGMAVLDAACGTGYGVALLLQEARPEQIVGMDLAEDAIERATALRLPGAKFVVGSVCDLPFESASFDVYLSFETIEHLEEVEPYLEEAKRVVRSGGLFVVSTPNRDLTNPGKTVHDKPFNQYHVREWNSREFRQLISSHFQDVQFLTQSVFPRGYRALLRCANYVSLRRGYRAHQAVKVLLHMLRLFPRCTVHSGDSTRGEVLVALARIE